MFFVRALRFWNALEINYYYYYYYYLYNYPFDCLCIVFILMSLTIPVIQPLGCERDINKLLLLLLLAGLPHHDIYTFKFLIKEGILKQFQYLPSSNLSPTWILCMIGHLRHFNVSIWIHISQLIKISDGLKRRPEHSLT